MGEICVLQVQLQWTLFPSLVLNYRGLRGSGSTVVIMNSKDILTLLSPIDRETAPRLAKRTYLTNDLLGVTASGWIGRTILSIQYWA